MARTHFARMQEVITEIDPTLKLREIYKDDISQGVVRVTRRSKPMVLRWGEDKKEGFRSIHKEIATLEKLCDVERTPNLIEVYANKPRVALLRSYISGQDLVAYLRGAYFERAIVKKDWRAYSRIKRGVLLSGRELVRQVHAKGISNLDLQRKNILVNKGKVYLFDFDITNSKAKQGLFAYVHGRINDKINYSTLLADRLIP